MESHKEELIQMISDHYKSLHGIRPRWEYAEMRGETIEQLQQRLDKLDADVADELRQERADAERRNAIRDGAWIGNAEPVNPFSNL
jgi:predicted small metal-binding protein